MVQLELLPEIFNQTKNLVEQRIEVVKKSSVPDLREKLSGIPSQRPQFISTVQVPKPAREIINSDKPVQKKDPPSNCRPSCH